MVVRNHMRRHLDMIRNRLLQIHISRELTSQQLSLEVHIVERVSYLIVIRLDLPYKKVSACAIMCDLHVAPKSSFFTARNVLEIQLTLRDLLQSFVSHDCENYFEGSRATSR